MNFDPTAFSFGLVGVLTGISLPLWRAKSELEERCEFLSEMGSDLSYAFETVDLVLEDKNTPKPIGPLFSSFWPRMQSRSVAKTLRMHLWREP